jgi:hypothetical protein
MSAPQVVRSRDVPFPGRRPAWQHFAIRSLLAAGTLAAPSVHAQTVVLNDGFESYATGHFNVLGPWTGHDGLGPGCSIVSTPVHDGSRALEVNMILGPNPPDPTAPHARYYFPCPSASGSLELDVMKGSNDKHYLEIALREGNYPVPSAAQSFDIQFTWFAEVRYRGADYPFSSLGFSYNGGQWYHIRIDWHANSTADVWIDNVLQGAGLPFHSPMTAAIEWIGLAIHASEAGQEIGWFDNVKVTLDNPCATPAHTDTWGRLKSIYR